MRARDPVPPSRHVSARSRPARLPVAGVALFVGAVLVVVGAAGLVPRAATGPVAAAPTATAATTPSPSPSPPGPAPRDEIRRAVRILAAWDRARAEAYAAANSRRLAGLYAPGARAAVNDLALLDRYTAVGVRVRDLRMQLLALDVLASEPDRLRLLVTDRVRADAVGPDGVVPLRSGGPSTRVVVLERQPGGTWRISAVRPRSGR